MKYFIILFLLFFLQSQIVAQTNKSTEQILLDYILKKNPTTFNADTTKSSEFYSESFHTDIPVYQHSLLILNKEKKGTAKFLEEIQDSVLSKFFPTTKFYYFHLTCHYEYNLGVLKTIYLVDSVFDDTAQNIIPLEYTLPLFINFLQKAQTSNKTDKQNLSISLGRMILMLHQDSFGYSEDNKQWFPCTKLSNDTEVETTGIWKDNMYKLILLEPRLCIDSKTKEESIKFFPYFLQFTFENDKILNIEEGIK